MKIAYGVARVLFVAFLFYVSATLLGDRYGGSFPSPGSFQYGAGNAPQSLRSEVMDTLVLFQEGYVARDPELLEDFMHRLFSSENTTILGTMPREIYVGFDQAAELVRTDWQSWGDCLFDLENVHISNSGDVVWFATVGFVEFDLSSLLVLPLRLSGVLVLEDGRWRFQYLQFQFDLDLSLLLLCHVLIGIMLAIQLVWLALRVIRQLQHRGHAPEPA